MVLNSLPKSEVGMASHTIIPSDSFEGNCATHSTLLNSIELDTSFPGWGRGGQILLPGDMVKFFYKLKAAAATYVVSDREKLLYYLIIIINHYIG